MNLGSLLVDGLQWLQANWIVFAAIIALFIYGRFHFNTPEYALRLTDKNGRPLGEAGQLVSLAPPRFTTSRIRFERFAFGYVLILAGAFLCIVFLPGLLSAADEILPVKVPTPDIAQPIEYRTLFALFAVTGALSSFPILKDIDGWILKKLHQAALIPYEAERLAKQLHDAELVSTEAAMASIRETLDCRDPIRVAEGRASGSLESTLLKTMWLKSKLLELTTSSPKYLQFSIQVQRDLEGIASISSTLKSDLASYFKAQEEVVPSDIENIDHFFNINLEKPDVKPLHERRQRLLQLCTALYYRECLIASLLVYATQFTPSQVEETLKEEIGFQIEVTATPAWDWDTIVRVVGSTFVAALVLAAGFAGYIDWFGLPWPRAITRAEVVAAAITETLAYVFILLIAIRLKRYWHFNDRKRPRLPENLLIAIAGFSVTILCNLAFASSWRIETYILASIYQAAPYGIAAYFVGIYIDRSMQMKEKSLRPVLWQGALQSVAMFFAYSFSYPGQEIMPTLAKAAYLGIEAGCLGMVMAFMFQRYHKVTQFSPEGPQGRVVTRVGDLSFQRRSVAPTRYKSS